MKRKHDTPQPAAGNLIYASDDARNLLHRNQILDGRQVFSLGNPIYNRHKGRSVRNATLEDEQGRHIRIFIKTHQGRIRLCPRMTDLKDKQVFGSSPEREWYGIEKLAGIGIKVPERLALFREGLFVFRSGIVVRDVPPRQSIDQMMQSGSWQNLSHVQQCALLDEVVFTMQTVHRAGLIWRGASSRHFYPVLQDDERWRLWLIDCEGVYSRKSRSAIDRNYLKLFRSMKESGADFNTLERLRRRIEAARAGNYRSENLLNERDSIARRAA